MGLSPKWAVKDCTLAVYVLKKLHPQDLLVLLERLDPAFQEPTCSGIMQAKRNQPLAGAHAQSPTACLVGTQPVARQGAQQFCP